MTKTFKELRESTSVDEISLKSLSKTIAKSTGTKNTQLAMKKSKDKTRDDLAAMRKRLDSLKAGYAAESVELDEAISKTIDAMKQIVAKKQAMKIDGVMVDMFTASAVTQIYDKVNDANKAKMDKMKATQLASVAMKMLKKEGVENLEELTAAEKKLINQMYDKKGNLTPLGKKVFAAGQKNEEVELEEGTKLKDAINLAKKQLKTIDDRFTTMIGIFNGRGQFIPGEMKFRDKMEKDGYQYIGFVHKDGSVSLKKGFKESVDEAPRRKGAPKITGDYIAIQRAKDAELNKALGRTKTGRKKPVRTMTSTQRALASLRREEVELDEAKGMNMNLKLINKIKKSGVVKTGSMSKDGSKKEETNEVLDTPKAMQSYKDKANYSRDKAARSAVATTLRSKDKAQRDHPAKDLKTMDKRTKGLKMADRNAKLKTFNALRRKEDVSEAKKGGYDIYHKDFSGAMQHAYAAAKKNYGITIKPSEIDNKVASGPRKPSSGKTNTYRLEGDKGAIQVQVYNTGSKYELNMYKE